MTKVFVTGASGFVGRNFLIASPKEWQIVATYSSSEDFPAFLDSHDLEHVRAVRCDLTDTSAVRRLFSEHGRRFDSCLYLASNVSIPLSVNQPITDLEVNTVALLNVLEHIRCDRFVYMSSGAVYDGLIGNIDPTVALNPRIPYAISKRASELYVQFYRHRRGTLGSYVNLRFFGAFGPFEPARKIYTKLVRALAIERSTEFIVTGDGSNLIDAMYISDAVDGIMHVLASNAGDITIDFASGTPISIDSLVRRSATLFQVPVNIVHGGRTEEYIEFSADPEPMAKKFDFRPSVQLEDGLARFYEHLKKQE